MKYENEYCSFWYTRIQGVLCLMVLLAWGIGDALTALYMIKQQGLMQEGNMLVRSIITYYGVSTFVMLKISFTLMILYIPFIVKQDRAYWMINGYLVSFIIGGALAMVLNMQAALNQPLFMLPQHVILIYISSILILTNIGEIIDKVTHPKTRSFFDCGLNDTRYLLDYMDTIEQKRRTERAKKVITTLAEPY
jgi:hypothetical protein